MTVSEWADRYRMLSSEASSEPGRWQTDRAAYQREILDAINDASVEQVVMMSSAQVGKTEILLNIIGYFVDYDPSPMLMLQPTLEMAQTFSKDRIAPMFRDTDRLKGKLQGPKSRSSGNTMLHKSFTGGHITMAGANSPASLASRPIRILLCDEVDRYPVSAGAEGDPVNLARKRTNNFWNRKIVLVSTPTIKGVSRIESAYESSTKEIYQLCCPGCGNYQQILRQHLVHFYIDDNKNELERVDAACESCGCLHTDVEWKSNPGRWLKLNPGHRHRGFHLNEYVSPWRRWVEIEHDFLDAKKSKEALKTFVNTSLGETWEEEGKTVNHSNLYLRREPYEKIPEKALLLVAGVDVQDDRIEGEVIAYGAEHESWGIESFVLHGDPGRPVLWQQLQQRIAKQYEHESGQYLSITATCVDSGGHYTQQVYEFCKKNQYRRVWAVKGASTAGKPIASRPSTNNKGGVKLFTVGTGYVGQVRPGLL